MSPVPEIDDGSGTNPVPGLSIGKEDESGVGESEQTKMNWMVWDLSSRFLISRQRYKNNRKQAVENEKNRSCKCQRDEF